MGRASKWFRGLLSFRKPDPIGEPAPKPPSKRKWSFPKGKHRRKSHHGGVARPGAYVDEDETSRQAIAVAAATAAVAEAAVAAAHAAAAVAQLTTAGGFERTAACGGGNNVAGYLSREERAAVVIQSHFRAYLSRRALRALKALVKLQALVRGHILRKQNVDKLRQLEALVRAQARARAGRGPLSEASHLSSKTSRFNHTGRAPQEKVDHTMPAARSTKHDQPTTSKRNGLRSSSNLVYDKEKSPLVHHWTERRAGEAPWEQGSFITRIVRVDNDKSDKVLEVDTGRPSITPVPRNIVHSSQPSHTSDQYSTYSLSKETASASLQTTWLSPSSGGVQALSPLAAALNSGGSPFYTANNSPAYYSASSIDGSSKRAPFTPAKSCLSGYSDHPSYMAYTESSKAKARSLSAPKQRPQWERSSCSQWERSNSVNRYSVLREREREREREIETRVSAQKTSTSFGTRGYQGSGRLDKYGVPVRDVSGFSGGLWHRY